MSLIDLISKDILIKSRFIKDLKAPIKNSNQQPPSFQTQNKMKSYMLGLLNNPIPKTHNTVFKSFRLKQSIPLNVLHSESHQTKMSKKKRELLKMVTENNSITSYATTTMTSDPNNILLKNASFLNEVSHNRINANSPTKNIYFSQSNNNCTNLSNRYTRNSSLITQSKSPTRRSRSPGGSFDCYDSLPLASYDLMVSKSNRVITNTRHNRYLSGVSSVNTFKPFDL